MPDRLPTLILLVGCWIPPAVVGFAVANVVHRSRKHVRPVMIYAGLAVAALVWSLAWFLFQLNRIPPYVPGATHDPTYAPPEAIAGLAVVASALVFPVSAIAFALVFRNRVRSLRRESPAQLATR